MDFATHPGVQRAAHAARAAATISAAAARLSDKPAPWGVDVACQLKVRVPKADGRRDSLGSRRSTGPVRLKLNVYAMSEEEAKAKEEATIAAAEEAAREVAWAKAEAKAKTVAKEKAEAKAKAKMDAEAEAIAKAKSNISVTIRTLVLEDAEALDCRRLKFEIDVLGLNKGAAAQGAPTAMSHALTVRSAAASGGEMVVDFTQHTSLPPNSRARQALRSALISETLEDSDVFLVLHGLGGASRDGREMATGMINLEELLADEEDITDRWVDLVPPSSSEPLGRALVSVTALAALRAIKKEAVDAPPPPPPAALPEGPERFRLSLSVDSVTLRSFPEHACFFALRLRANGDEIASRSHKCIPPTGLLATTALPRLPIAFERTLFLGPSTPLFPALLGHAAPPDSAAQQAGRDVAADLADAAADAADAAGLSQEEGEAAVAAYSGLRWSLVERREGEWYTVARGWLDGGALLNAVVYATAAEPSLLQVPLIDSLGSASGAIQLRLHAEFLGRSLLQHSFAHGAALATGSERAYRAAGLLPPIPPPAPAPEAAPEVQRTRSRRDWGSAPDDEVDGASQSEGGGRPGEVSIEIEISAIKMNLIAPKMEVGTRLHFEITIGDTMTNPGLLHSPLSSRLIRADGGSRDKPIPVGYRRTLTFARDMPLWRECARRLIAAERDPRQAELRITVYSISAGTEADSKSRRRQLGVVTHSLRQQLISGDDLIHRALPLVDGRGGAPLASVWISVAANSALGAMCSGIERVGALALPPPAERRNAAELRWTTAIAAIRLQAMARSFRARRQLRLQACELRQSITIRVHELRLPADLCTPDAVHAAALTLDFAGIRLISPADRSGTFRPRAGKTVLFELITTIDLERDSPAYSQLFRALDNQSTPCELRATLTAERLAPTDSTGRRKSLGTDARFTIGEVRLNLHVLLASGSDLLEKPLPVRSKARTGAIAAASSSPMLVVSVEGVDALDTIARALRPAKTDEKGKPAIVSSAQLARQRWKKVSMVQALFRGHLARTKGPLRALKLAPTAPKEGMEHVQLQVAVMEVRPAANEVAEMLLAAGQEFCIELDAADLSQNPHVNDTVRSPWTSLPLAPSPETTPHGASLTLDMKHGGRARSLLRAALYSRQMQRGAVQLRLLVAAEGHGKSESRSAKERAAKAVRAAAVREGISGSPGGATAGARRGLFGGSSGGTPGRRRSRSGSDGNSPLSSLGGMSLNRNRNRRVVPMGFGDDEEQEGEIGAGCEAAAYDDAGAFEDENLVEDGEYVDEYGDMEEVAWEDGQAWGGSGGGFGDGAFGGGGSGVVTIGTTLLPLLPLAPADDATGVASNWLEVRAQDGSVLMELKVEVADVQLLRRLHAANRLREADERLASDEVETTTERTPRDQQQQAATPASAPGTASSPGAASPAEAGAPSTPAAAQAMRPRSSAVDLSTLVSPLPLLPLEEPGDMSMDGGSRGANDKDMVDALRRHVAMEAVEYATTQNELVLSRFISNPDATELEHLLPRLSSVPTLDLAYCLELRNPLMLLLALRTLRSLKTLDLMACNLADDGATSVGAALGGGIPNAPNLVSLCLRANRIRSDGAAAIGNGAARATSLRRLDLSANPIGDVGLMRLVLGSDNEAADASRDASPGASTGADTPDPDEAVEGAGVGTRRKGKGGRREPKERVAEENVLRGLRYCSGLKALLLSKVGLGAKALPAIGALVASLGELVELDLSVNAFNGVDEYGLPAPVPEGDQPAGINAAMLAATDESMDGGGRSPNKSGRASPTRPARGSTPTEPVLSAEATLAATAKALREDSIEAVSQLGGGGNAEWEWPNAMRSLGRLLGTRTNLRKLAIQHTAARARVGYCVAMACHPTVSVARLSHINLQGTSLSEPALTELCKALTQRGPLGPTELNLEGCIRRSPGALPALWQLVSAAACSLTSLNIGYNALQSGAELGAALAANARNGGRLIELDIGSNELGGEFVDGGICAMCAPLLAVGLGVNSIDLSYTHLGLKGAQALAAMLLVNNCALTSLRLDGCGLGSDGVAALAAAVGDTARCAPLKDIRMEYNSMGPAGMKALAAALPAKQTLGSLYIGCNGLGEEGMRYLADAITVCAHLVTIDVGDNDLDEACLRTLLEGVRSQYALTALDVSNNRFGDGGAEALASELRSNPSLLFIRAAGNEIGPTGGAALASALAESIAMLDMTHNNAVGYADLMAVRLSNNRRAPGAPPSPLDGWSKAEND